MSLTIVRKSVIRQKNERIKTLEMELEENLENTRKLTEESIMSKGIIARLQNELNRYKPKQGKDGKFVKKENISKK